MDGHRGLLESALLRAVGTDFGFRLSESRPAALAPEQRRHAVAKLRGYAEDFRELAAQQMALVQPQ
jgi:hypothetical protein